MLTVPWVILRNWLCPLTAETMSWLLLLMLLLCLKDLNTLEAWQSSSKVKKLEPVKVSSFLLWRHSTILRLSRLSHSVVSWLLLMVDLSMTRVFTSTARTVFSWALMILQLMEPRLMLMYGIILTLALNLAITSMWRPSLLFLRVDGTMFTI